MRIEVSGQTLSIESLKLKAVYPPVKRRKGAYGWIGTVQPEPDIDLHVAFLDSRQAKQFRALAVGNFTIKWVEDGARYQALCVDIVNDGLKSIIPVREVFEI